MSQQCRHGLGVGTFADEQRGIRVPQTVEADMTHSVLFGELFKIPIRGVVEYGAAVPLREQPGMVFPLGTPGIPCPPNTLILPLLILYQDSNNS